jgi:hypothetical protein
MLTEKFPYYAGPTLCVLQKRNYQHCVTSKHEMKNLKHLECLVGTQNCTIINLKKFPFLQTTTYSA